MKQTMIHFLTAVFISLVLILTGCQIQEENWTHFRGSNLDGIANVNRAPLQWTTDSNILWKTEIHDKGWSSPVVFGDQIWITTALENGKELFAVCVDYKTGKISHDIKVFTPDSVYNKHGLNSFATPTPCIEKDFVYVHFGRYGTACLSTSDGSIVWTRTDLLCDHVQGPASSPVIYKNLLILHMEGVDRQYIVALEKNTGKTVWTAERKKELYDPLEWIGKKAYITPLIINVNGRDIMISNGSAVTSAYDPETGKEIWWIIRGVDSTIAMPFSEDGIVYFHTGFLVTPEGDNYAQLLAVNPDGEGDISGTNILWTLKTPILQLQTPVIRNGLIYTIDPDNNLMCLDAKTGESIYSTRVKGKFDSSPVYASGHIYFCSTKGAILVVKEGREPLIIAENSVDGEIWATPAILRNSILLRTSKYLYRIGT